MFTKSIAISVLMVVLFFGSVGWANIGDDNCDHYNYIFKEKWINSDDHGNLPDHKRVRDGLFFHNYKISPNSVECAHEW